VGAAYVVGDGGDGGGDGGGGVQSVECGVWGVKSADFVAWHGVAANIEQPGLCAVLCRTALLSQWFLVFGVWFF